MRRKRNQDLAERKQAAHAEVLRRQEGYTYNASNKSMAQESFEERSPVMNSTRKYKVDRLPFFSPPSLLYLSSLRSISDDQPRSQVERDPKCSPRPLPTQEFNPICREQR